MPKDTYAAILKELRDLIKQIIVLRKRSRDFRERVIKECDKGKIGKIRKQLGL